MSVCLNVFKCRCVYFYEFKCWCVCVWCVEVFTCMHFEMFMCVSILSNVDVCVWMCWRVRIDVLKCWCVYRAGGGGVEAAWVREAAGRACRAGAGNQSYSQLREPHPGRARPLVAEPDLSPPPAPHHTPHPANLPLATSPKSWCKAVVLLAPRTSFRVSETTSARNPIFAPPLPLPCLPIAPVLSPFPSPSPPHLTPSASSTSSSCRRSSNSQLREPHPWWARPPVPEHRSLLSPPPPLPFPHFTPTPTLTATLSLRHLPRARWAHFTPSFENFTRKSETTGTRTPTFDHNDPDRHPDPYPATLPLNHLSPFCLPASESLPCDVSSRPRGLASSHPSRALSSSSSSSSLMIMRGVVAVLIRFTCVMNSVTCCV